MTTIPITRKFNKTISATSQEHFVKMVSDRRKDLNINIKNFWNQKSFDSGLGGFDARQVDLRDIVGYGIYDGTTLPVYGFFADNTDNYWGLEHHPSRHGLQARHVLFYIGNSKEFLDYLSALSEEYKVTVDVNAKTRTGQKLEIRSVSIGIGVRIHYDYCMKPD